MDSKKIAFPTPGGARTCLSEALPLDTPYLIQIFPCYACNFRCEYCVHSIKKENRTFISDVVFMDWELYKKCIDDIKRFPRKLKMLRFAAIGEPLLHPRIADMVAYARAADISDSIDIVTNASLLTNSLSDALIKAGLGRLRISLEGLTADEYMKNAGVEQDVNALRENIKYFYDQKKDTDVYIKIIDYMLRLSGQEELFYEMFNPICDSIAIEHLTPSVHEIDYSAMLNGSGADLQQSGEALIDAEICPQGFYLMQINPDGKVVPCCNMTYPTILGDTNINGVPEIWNGRDFNSFRRNMLDSRAVASDVCKDCLLYKYTLHKTDVLDMAAEKLRRVY